MANPATRQPTFVGNTSNSRLDDILCYSPANPVKYATAKELTTPTTSDHCILTVRTNYHNVQWILTTFTPVQTKTWEERFVTPMKPEQLQQYKSQCDILTYDMERRLTATLR